MALTEPSHLNAPVEGDAYPVTLGFEERYVQVLELPYPPSVNNFKAIFKPKNGPPRLIITSEGRAYQKQAIFFARSQGVCVMKGDIRVRYDLYRPRKAGDLSNFIKVVEDCLKGIAWDDDNQVVYMECHRHDDKLRPRVEITIEGERV